VVDRIEVDDHAIRIIGDEATLEQVIVGSTKTAPGVRSFVPKWRALSIMNSRARPDVAAARELLQKAVALDSGYAQAHNLLAFVITLGAHMGWEPPESTLALASDAAHKAKLLDADDPWTHVAVGYVLARSRRASDAIVEYEKALALNPNFAIAHYLLAWTYCMLGRSEEAFAHADWLPVGLVRDTVHKAHGGCDAMCHHRSTDRSSRISCFSAAGLSGSRATDSRSTEYT